jgi:hypothetical protein
MTNLSADGNGNHIVDAADYVIWRGNLASNGVIPGDYDRDTDVDGGDLVLWRQQFGSMVAAFSGADGNGNGTVDAADYVVWRDNIGAASTTILQANVPEPPSFMLLVVGSVAVRQTRRERRGIVRSTDG